jgi:hypothetical protein
MVTVAMVGAFAAPAGAPFVGPNVAPGGSPVVSIGITPVATRFSATGAPHLGQRPALADDAWPQRAQTMGK